MLTIRSILCPTDFSECSDRALVYAVDLAIRFQAKLYVQHVDENLIMAPGILATPADVEAVRADYEHDIMAALHPHLRPDLAFTTILIKGKPHEEILKAAKEHAVDWIVMGTHGRKGFSRWMLGSVTEPVIQRAPCPMLTVCHNTNEPQRPVAFRRVLVPVDFSDAARRAVEYAWTLREAFSSEVHLLHVIENPILRELAAQPLESEADVKRSRTAIQERLAALIPETMRKPETVKEMIKTGNTPREILQAVRAIPADLIVLGVGEHGAIERALFGSTTFRVLRDAPCPVLTVRSVP